MSKVTILTKPNRIVIASKGVQGPPGPGGGGGGIPDAPSDGDTYGRKDGEWEAIAEPEVPTLQAVLEKGDTTDQQLIFTYDDDDVAFSTEFSANGLFSSLSFLGVNSYYSAMNFQWTADDGGSIALAPSLEFLSGSGRRDVTIPYKTGTILLDSDIGTLVASQDAIPVWVEITQAAYDALDPPDPNTLYVVID